MSLYQQQREQVKESILDTSVAIFRQKGYENATIDEITKTVGIAKGTFYNFFSSKSEILISWAAQKFQKVNIHEAFNINKTLEKNLYKFIEILVEAIENEEQLFQCFLKEILKVHGDKNYNKKFDFVNIYRLIIKNSSDSDKVSGSLLDIKIDVLNNSLFMGIINWFDAGNSVEGLNQYLTNIVRMCLYGLLSDVKEG
jgi:AcrR family transcriptional regulator